MTQPNAWSQFGEIGMFQVEKVRSPAPQKSGIGIKKDSPSIWLDLVSLGAVGCQLPRDRGAGKTASPERMQQMHREAKQGSAYLMQLFQGPAAFQPLGSLIASLPCNYCC